MPHATSEMPLTNGTAPSSKFLSHLNSYPVVSDGVETFKSHPVGRKSIDLSTSAYQRFGKPVEPYLETPYSYAKPYVTKADELASSGLDRVDTYIPIVKEDTSTIVDKGKSIVWYPFKVADDGKNYLVGTWQDEYKKTASHNNRGDGVQTYVMALISTELRLASEFLQTVADYIGPKYQDSKDKAAELTQQAQDKASEYKQLGQEKFSEAQKLGQEKLGEAQKKGDEYTKQAQEKGEQVKQDAKNAKEDAKHKAERK